MGEIVNLRRARKARAQAAAAQRAAENRARAGLTKAERTAEAKRRALADSQLEAARLPSAGKERQPGTANRANSRASSS